MRVVRRYDTYVRRNLQRGLSGRDMGVPFWKEQALRLGMAVEQGTAGVSAQLHRFTEAAESWQAGFFDAFDRARRSAGEAAPSLLTRLGAVFGSPLADPRHASDDAAGAAAGGAQEAHRGDSTVPADEALHISGGEGRASDAEAEVTGSPARPTAAEGAEPRAPASPASAGTKRARR